MFTRTHKISAIRKTISIFRPVNRLILAALVTTLLLAACATPGRLPPATETAAPAPENATPAAAEAPAQAVAAPTATAAAPATTAPSAQGVAAFVRDGVLTLQNGADASTAIAVEDCSQDRCFIHHLRWSPSGTHLLYYVGSYDGSVPHQYRITDRSGVTHTVTEAAPYIQPAAWAPDGSAVAYRVDTGEYADVTDGPALRVHELWTVAVAEDGALGEPVRHGDITFGEGCGGGGRSESATAYEREGGFAYGYLSGVMVWSPGGILLYSDNCTTRGISRFDLVASAPLDSIPNGLRSLSLNAAGDQWVAINDPGQLVIGTPRSVEITVIPTTTRPEMVFFGKRTGTVYYTTLDVVDQIDLVEEAGAWMDQSIGIFPSFDRTVVTIVGLDPALPTESETVLYADEPEAYAYANVRENATGGIIFSRVESNIELQTAVENQLLTAENWRDYLPNVDVMSLGPGGEAYLLIANATQYTPAP